MLTPSTCVGLQLYNESLRDLLNPNSKLVPTIHERDGKVCVDNLEEGAAPSTLHTSALQVNVPSRLTVPVRSPEEVQLQLKKGENNRRVGKTDFNEHSSRSHTVFSIVSLTQRILTSDRITDPLLTADH